MLSKNQKKLLEKEWEDKVIYPEDMKEIYVKIKNIL